MPSTRDIRRRIKSVKNTAQITKAMQMVASAKMRKAQQAALAGRPYAALMNKVLAHATAGAGDFTHELLEKRAVKKRAVILISTDKGLCGALNTNLLREAAKFDKDSTVFICAGKKAGQWAARTKRTIAADGATALRADPWDPGDRLLGLALALLDALLVRLLLVLLRALVVEVTRRRTGGGARGGPSPLSGGDADNGTADCGACRRAFLRVAHALAATKRQGRGKRAANRRVAVHASTPLSSLRRVISCTDTSPPDT